ncbi:MAG: RNA-binding protein, partial [Acidobacteriota bacterium]
LAGTGFVDHEVAALEVFFVEFVDGLAGGLFVGNLNFRTTEDELRELFETFGQVDDLIILNDRETGRSRGFGFVTLADEESARKAIDELHEKDFQGRNLVVNEARPREPRPAGSGYGGGNRGGYSGGGRSSGGGYSGGSNRDNW